MNSLAAEIGRFEAFCGELRTESGAPFKPYPEQLLVLTDYFEGVTQTLIIIGKKNGKSTLIAALALYHLLITPNAECIIVAAAREQAEIVLRQARMFIRNSPALQQHVTVQKRSILSNQDEGRIRVLASDEDTADGVIPTLAIVDELHRHKSSELYGVLVGGLGPRNGQLICISTAGAKMDSPLGEKREAAHKLPSFRRVGKYNYARTETLAFHEFCLDAADDTNDMTVVKQANPAPWHTEASLRHLQSTLTAFQWLRFACGIWTEGEEPWIEPGAWDSLSLGMSPPGSPIVLGVKVRIDESAIVMFGNKTAEAHILQGADLEEVENKILALSKEYVIQTVAYDPSAFRRSAEILEGRGLDMTEFPITPERMSVASVTLKRLIETKELRRSDDPAFRAHVLAGTVKEGERGWRLVSDPGRPLSALIALAMAVQVSEDLPAMQEARVAWV